jgi:hypothetical protein
MQEQNAQQTEQQNSPLPTFRKKRGQVGSFILTVEEADELEERLRLYGHDKDAVKKQADGVWLEISANSRLQFQNGRVLFHGQITDDAIAAGMRHAQAAWGGHLYVHGSDEDFKLRTWAHAQVAGVVVENYEPPEHLRQRADGLVKNLRAKSGHRYGLAQDRTWGYAVADEPPSGRPWNLRPGEDSNDPLPFAL